MDNEAREQLAQLEISTTAYEGTPCRMRLSSKDIDQILNKLHKLGYRKIDTKIICLCGSTRFTNEMLVIQWNFTKQGYVVLSWCALPENYYWGDDKTHIGDKEGVKEIVDEVHKRKIDIADEIFVVNIGGYIGESTTNEIQYALAHNKPVKFYEPEWKYPFQLQAQLKEWGIEDGETVCENCHKKYMAKQTER